MKGMRGITCIETRGKHRTVLKGECVMLISDIFLFLFLVQFMAWLSLFVLNPLINEYVDNIGKAQRGMWCTALQTDIHKLKNK